MAIEPFLPEHVPAAATPASSGASRKKTLALWVALIVMFLVIWQFLNPPPPPHHARGAAEGDTSSEVAPARPCVEESAWSRWPSYAFAPGALFLMIFFFLRRFGDANDFNAGQEPAMLALAEGRVSEAATLFRSTLSRYSKKPILRGIVHTNVAHAELWAGDLGASVQAAAEAERALGPVGVALGATLRVVASSDLALGYALLGDLPSADRWVTETRARIAKTTGERIAWGARLAIVEAIELARRGAHVEAAALLEARWSFLRYGLSANYMRVAEIVRAFAEAQGDLRQQNTVGERIVRIEPVRKGEFRFLGVAWPEMRVFLAAHQIGEG